jgi:hypothetical protein
MNRACAVWASLLLVATGAAADSLYVKIQDLNPVGAGAFAGADIEAVELYDGANQRAYYVTDIVAAQVPGSGDDGGPDSANLRGLTVLADWDAPYVYSLNGGWVVVKIDTGANPVADDFRLTVYEVDGSLYHWGGAPDPYRVEVARAAEGPWKVLGIGSGTARFTLDGDMAPALDEETAEKIADTVARKPDNDPITDDLREKMAPTLARLAALRDPAQLGVELDGFHRFYHYRDHVVNEHGEVDGGRVMAPWLLLEAAWERYRQIR